MQRRSCTKPWERWQGSSQKYEVYGQLLDFIDDYLCASQASLPFIQVAQARTKAEEAKSKAQAALDKATATKNKVERSNNDLRDLIKQIRGFLTRESEILFIDLQYYSTEE